MMAAITMFVVASLFLWMNANAAEYAINVHTCDITDGNVLHCRLEWGHSYAPDRLLEGVHILTLSPVSLQPGSSTVKVDTKDLMPNLMKIKVSRYCYRIKVTAPKTVPVICETKTTTLSWTTYKPSKQTLSTDSSVTSTYSTVITTPTTTKAEDHNGDDDDEEETPGTKPYIIAVSVLSACLSLTVLTVSILIGILRARKKTTPDHLEREMIYIDPQTFIIVPLIIIIVVLKRRRGQIRRLQTMADVMELPVFQKISF